MNIIIMISFHYYYYLDDDKNNINDNNDHCDSNNHLNSMVLIVSSFTLIPTSSTTMKNNRIVTMKHNSNKFKNKHNNNNVRLLQSFLQKQNNNDKEVVVEKSNKEVKYNTANNYYDPKLIAQEWIDSFSNDMKEIREKNEENDDQVYRINTFLQKHFIMIQNENDATNTDKQWCYWRDMLFYTWNIVTMHKHDEINTFLLWYYHQQQQLQKQQNDNNDNKDKNMIHWRLDDTKEIVVHRETKTRKEEDSVDDEEYYMNSNNIIKQIDFWCHIEDTERMGRAQVRLTRTYDDDSNYIWKAKTLLTVLTELKQYPFAIGKNRIRGTEHGPILNRQYWHEKNDDKQRQHDQTDNNNMILDDDTKLDYYVIIIGGGQGGLSLGARLQILNIPYIIYETNDNVGTSWLNRYPSLVLHDPCYYNHMPYIEFPNHWPIFCSRNKLANFLQSYSNIMDLNIQTNTRVIHAEKQQKDDDDGTSSSNWIITIEMKIFDNPMDNTNNFHVIRKTIHTKHLVFATGNTSHPKIPSFINNNNQFHGIQFHSSQYRGGKELYQDYIISSQIAKTNNRIDDDSKATKINNKPNMIMKTPMNNKHNRRNPIRIVVIGCNNSAWDICQDLWEQQQYYAMHTSSSNTNDNGFYDDNKSTNAECEENDNCDDTNNVQITMIQRSSSMVVSTDSVLTYGLGPLYRQDAPLHHEEADIIATIVPYHMALQNNWINVNNQMKINDKLLHEQLKNIGYELDIDGPYNAGIFAKSATEGGGFYINMGCAELMINKQINVLYSTIQHINDDSITVYNKRSNMNETIPADIIIYATGYNTMDYYVQKICGNDISEQVGRTWGLGLGYNVNKDPGPWEGELRNMWKPTNVDGLWFQGGNLAQNRHYSKFLALQLAARYHNIPTPVYGIPKPTPPSD